MMRWTLDRSEDVYYSNTREPLGKSWRRGHSIPSHLGTEVPFGQRVNAKQNSAISLARGAIAPVDHEYEVWSARPARPCSTCSNTESACISEIVRIPSNDRASETSLLQYVMLESS